MDDAYLDQQLGPRLNWTPRERPARPTLSGQYATLVPMTVEHAPTLWDAVSGEGADPDLWLYLGNGPYATEAEFTSSIQDNQASWDPQFYTILDTDGTPVGQASYMRMDPANSVIEIGHIWFGGRVQRAPLATEAIYLLAKHVFDDLGYRRLEWKTTSLNMRSRAAALRFGFQFEGIFRNHMVIRDRNRDTAWYGMTSEDWPRVKAAFEAWLSPDNFDADGQQIASLRSLREG